MAMDPALQAQTLDILSSHDDWRERRKAALMLGRAPSQASFEGLCKALTDRDPDVRHGAILALADLGDQGALDVLCKPVFIEDPNPEIRWATVAALGRLGSLSIANALSRALEDPEWVVRNQALLDMGDFIRRIPDTIDGEQVKSLIRLLAIRDAEVRGLVIDALARRSTRGLDEMVDALRGKSRAVRAGVAEALGLSRDPRAVQPLIEASQDPISHVRRSAATGLGRLGDPAAVEALILLLGDSDGATCKAAVDALVAIGTPAVAPLCSALRHSISKLHRRNIIHTLGGLRHPQAVLPLLNTLSSTYYVVRQAATQALSAYGDSVVEALLPMVEVSEVPIEAILRAAAEEKTKRLRLRAIRALGEIKNAAAIRPLRQIMREDDMDIRRATQEALSKIGLAAWARYGAVMALGNIANCRAIPALIRALGDHSEYVRGEAARALAKISDVAAIPALIEALQKDDHRVVRREAAAALRTLGGQSPAVADALRSALDDEYWEVRVEATRALGRIDDDRSVEPLVKSLEDTSYTVRTSAEFALANLGNLALPRLLEIAAGPSSPRHRPALRALTQIFEEELHSWIEYLAECPDEERPQVMEEFKEHLRKRKNQGGG